MLVFLLAFIYTLAALMLVSIRTPIFKKNIIMIKQKKISLLLLLFIIIVCDTKLCDFAVFSNRAVVYNTCFSNAKN